MASSSVGSSLIGPAREAPVSIVRVLVVPHRDRTRQIESRGLLRDLHAQAFQCPLDFARTGPYLLDLAALDGQRTFSTNETSTVSSMFFGGSLAIWTLTYGCCVLRMVCSARLT